MFSEKSDYSQWDLICCYVFMCLEKKNQSWTSFLKVLRSILVLLACFLYQMYTICVLKKEYNSK
jgi:hypothetical protein